MNRVAGVVVLACLAVSGCSLKDLIAKADDAGAAAPVASAAVPAASAAAAAPAPAAVAANDAGAVVAKNAPTAVTAKAKGIPTCAKGQLMGTEAMSPFKAFCAAPCKTDADCKGVSCTSVNALTPEGTNVKSGPEFIKLCNPDVPTSAPAAKPTAAAAGSGGQSGVAAPKCGPNQHFDDLNKKCRAFGDCPKGFHWNDPMKTCLADD